jgi:hypothetical protein
VLQMSADAALLGLASALLLSTSPESVIASYLVKYSDRSGYEICTLVVRGSEAPSHF